MKRSKKCGTELEEKVKKQETRIINLREIRESVAVMHMALRALISRAFIPPWSFDDAEASGSRTSHFLLGNPCKTICVAISALKIGSKCSFITYKFRSFADFCLELTASLTFCRGSSENRNPSLK